jgi:4-amino-4-deoxy-L-arabinose transferase-like glycosyltransferase
VRKRAWRLLGEVLLGVAVLLAGLWVLGDSAKRVEMHGDEGVAIMATPYFEYLFIRRDLARDEWHDDSYAVHTHPMISRYLMGGWLWLQGYNERRLPQRSYRWSLSLEENRRQGRVPSEALLGHARTPMVVSGAGAVVLLYLLGRVLAGVPAGLVAAGLGLGSPLTQEYLVRARPDPPFVFFLLLALLFGVLGARRGRDGGLPLGWAIAVGLALGLAFGSKLTAVLGPAAAGGWGLLVAGLAAARKRDPSEIGAWAGRRRRALRKPLARAWMAGRGWALAVVVACGVFVISNPHLYPNPILHTTHLFAHRIEEGEVAQRYHPDAAQNIFERSSFVLLGSLAGGTLTGSRGAPLEALLAAAGVVALLAGSWREWRRTGRPPATGLVLLTGLAYFLGTIAFLPVTWDRYLLPTVLLGALFSGLGAAALIRQASALGAPFRGHQPVGEGTALRP